MREERSQKPFCPKPFTCLSVHADGKGWVCCHDWLDTPIGDLNRNTLREVWNSQTAQDVRESILDGSYRYCNAETCPDLVQGTLPCADQVHDPYLRKIIDNKLVRLERGPRTLGLTYDNTCNLKCPSCRSGFINLQGEAFKKAELIQAKILKEGMADAQQLVITGYGDAFASRLYRELLRSMDASEFPDLTIRLMTNGLLFNPAMWDSLEKIQPAIHTVEISIDAATPATYAINRGGNFDKLLRNLEFVSELLRNARLKWFEISFVVQANNFREMKQFVALGRSLRCNRILFQKLILWDDTYTEERYHEVAVHESSHPEHQEFLQVLRDPVFWYPTVDLSNLASLRTWHSVPF